MSWVSVRTVSFGMAADESQRRHGPKKPKVEGRKPRKSYRTSKNVIQQIRADIQKRDELRAELAKYTARAIGERYGLHERTVEKLMSK